MYHVYSHLYVYLCTIILSSILLSDSILLSFFCLFFIELCSHLDALVTFSLSFLV